MSRVNAYILGMVIGVLFTLGYAVLYVAIPKNQQLARLEAERDSLLEITNTLPRGVERMGYIQPRWVNLDSVYVDKGDKLILVYSRERQWPPETLKTTPMKRREK